MSSTGVFQAYFVISDKHGKLDIRLYLMFVSAWVATTFVILTCALISSAMHLASERLILSWNGNLLNKENASTLKVLRPVCIHVSSFYIMKKSTPLTYFRLLFESLINALLTI